MLNQPITIITPTTGNVSMHKLFHSLENQKIPWIHILLWDDKRSEGYSPDVQPREEYLSTRDDSLRYNIIIPGTFVKGIAYGSALRAIGLMAANTPYVTFADSDVWYDDNHLESLLDAVEGHNWAYCIRKIWASNKDYIGEDRFESIGDKTQLPYQLIDNNTLIVSRKFGASAACLYRETEEYNDDRLMYAFLKKYAGVPGETNKATVNQICPKKLEAMFRQYCTK
jgi:hypothetical protein